MTQIIAFAGRKQSGKTTCAEFVTKIFLDNKLGNAKVYNFADPLKMMCISIFGLTYDQCYGTDDQKNELVDCHWNNKQLSAREVLQLVGTEMFRTMQHNVWASATIRTIDKDQHPLSLIADCRFPNEVEAIKNSGGIVIKLCRNLYHSNHASEIALDPENYNQNNFDLIIDNQELTIKEQNKLIYDFLQNKGILPL
jgi:hypothetical protein